MKFSIIADEGDLVRVRCEGELVDAFYRAREPLETLIGYQGVTRNVLLSMEKVTFMDSSGISWLLARHKNFRENGGKFVIHDVPPIILQALEFVKLHRVLHIARDEAAARTLLGGVQV